MGWKKQWTLEQGTGVKRHTLEKYSRHHEWRNQSMCEETQWETEMVHSGSH